MPTAYSGNVAYGIQTMGEPVSLVQEAAGTWDTATQTHHSGAVTTTNTYAIARPVVEGVDGVTVREGDLEVWLSKDLLDVSSVTPQVKDQLIFGASKLIVLRVTTNNVMGYYRLRARGVE